MPGIRRWMGLFVIIAVAGCGEPLDTKKVATPSDTDAASEAVAPPATQPTAETTAEKETAATPEATAPAAAEGDVALTPENTKIEFVGLHVGDKPDPRKGSFAKFTGKASIKDKDLVSLNVDIETSSLSSEIKDLTDHLKSADFFNVKEHPKATFQSTSITKEGDTTTVTGDLTLLGKTESISFPATVSTENGLTLKAEFKIDRTKFGMEYGVDKVEKEVSMTVTVGG